MMFPVSSLLLVIRMPYKLAVTIKKDPKMGLLNFSSSSMYSDAWTRVIATAVHSYIVKIGKGRMDVVICVSFRSIVKLSNFWDIRVIYCVSLHKIGKDT